LLSFTRTALILGRFVYFPFSVVAALLGVDTTATNTALNATHLRFIDLDRAMETIPPRLRHGGHGGCPGTEQARKTRQEQTIQCKTAERSLSLPLAGRQAFRRLPA
jgi:hypothetical protein